MKDIRNQIFFTNVLLMILLSTVARSELIRYAYTGVAIVYAAVYIYKTK
jgi:hypothetical protein